MSSTDDPYSPSYGTATFTDTYTRQDDDDDSYTDSNSLEEVEASLNDLEDELEDTQHTVSTWSSPSYPGSPSFVSLPTTGTIASPPPLVRLSRITEHTEPESRPGSMAFRRSMHSRASTEPASAGLPPPGRANELIAVFEAAPLGGHTRGASTPAGPRSASPFYTPSQSVSDLSPYTQGFHSTFGSRPSSPVKSARVTSPGATSSTPSRTRPSMSTLLSQPPLSTTSGYTGTRTDTDSFTPSQTNTFSPSASYTGTFTPSNTRTYTTDTFTPSNTRTYTTDTFTPSNTHTYTTTTNTQTNPPVTPPSLRRPAQGSPRSPLSSVRNIVALWKERTPRKSPSASGSSSSSSSNRKSSSSGRPKPKDEADNDEGRPLPALPIDPEEDGLFAMRRRARPDDTASLRSASIRSASLRRRGSGSSTLPPALNMAELSAYAQSNEPPLHIGLLWFLNVHTSPPFRWQRCQALLYPHLLLLSWLAPGGGRGLVGLDLVHCTAVQSTPSPSHPGARDDVGSVAARLQSGTGEPGIDTLVDLLVPFQMLYDDGVERLAAESLLERQKWVNRIWEAVHRPPLAESSAGSSAGDADESGSNASSAQGSKIARSESIRTILSVDSASSSGSAGSRSTVFVPPVTDIPDIMSASESETGSYGRTTRTGTPSEAWRRAYTPTGTRTFTTSESRTGTWTPTTTRSGTWTPSEYTRTLTPTDARTYFSESPTRTGTYTSDTQTRSGTPGYTTTGSDVFTRTGTATFTHTGTATFTRTETPTSSGSNSNSAASFSTNSYSAATSLLRQTSFVPSHHSGTVDDSVIDRGVYVYPGDPRAIQGGRRGLGARRGSMGELDEANRASGSSEEFFSAEESAASRGSTSSGSGSATRTTTYTQTQTNTTTSRTPTSAFTRTGTLYSQSVGLRTGASGTFYSETFGSGSPSPTRTTHTPSYRDSGADSYSDYSGSAESYSSYTYGSSGSPSRTGTSLSRAREVRRRPGLGLGLGLGLGSSGVGTRTTSSGYSYTYSGSSSGDSYTRSSGSESEDKENSSVEDSAGDSNANGSGGGSGTGTGSGFTPATFSTNQTGYDVCGSSDLSDLTTRTTTEYSPMPSGTPSSSSPPSSGSSSPPPSSGSERFVTASQGSSSSSESEYTTALRPPSSVSSYTSFPTIPSESAYKTALEDIGDIPSEMGTPRPTSTILALSSEEGSEKGSLSRVPSLVPTIRSEVSSWGDYPYPPLPPSSVSEEEYPPLPPSTVVSEEEYQYPALPPSTVSVASEEQYPPLPPSTVVSEEEQYPPLPPSTASSEHFPPLPPSSVSSEQYPPLPPSTVSSEQYPPLPPSTVSSEQYPPLPPSTASTVSLTPSEKTLPLPPTTVSESISSPWVSDASSISFSSKSSSLPYLEPPTPYESSEESSDVATPISLEMSSGSSSVSGPSPVESMASTVYEPPSELSSTMSETSLTSSSVLTSLAPPPRTPVPPSPSPSSPSPSLRPPPPSPSWRRSWGAASSGTYDSSILGASPSVASIALYDPLDLSGETSFLRPTASVSSFDRMSSNAIPRSVSSFMTPPPVLQPLALTPVPSSSSSDISSPSSSEFPSESSSLVRTLSVLTQSSFLSDSSEEVESEPEIFEEPPTTPLLSTPKSMPTPRPPSSLGSSLRALRTPDASGSVSITTPRGNAPSVHSLLETVPSFRAPSTQGITLENLADELRRLGDVRGEENQEIAGNVRALRNELRDLADFLHRPVMVGPRPPSRMSPAPTPPTPVARLATPVPRTPTPTQRAPSIASAPSPIIPPPPSVHDSPVVGLLTPPPMSYVSSLSRSTSNASSVGSFLSSHYSDYEESQSPDSPYPDVERDLPVEAQEPQESPTADYSPGFSYRSSTSIPDPSSSSQSSGHPFPPPSDSPSSSSSSSTASSSSSSSSSSTVRPANYLPLLEGIRSAIDGLSATAGDQAALTALGDTIDGLREAQNSTRGSLDRLLERDLPAPPPPDNTELNDRMARIEDLLQNIINQPPPPPQPPIVIPAPYDRRSPSVSDSESTTWPSIIPPMRSIPQMPVAVPHQQGPSFLQQLDDLLSSAGSGVPLEPERPPPVVPFTFDVQGQGVRPRSGIEIAVPDMPARRSAPPIPQPPVRDPRRSRPAQPPPVPPFIPPSQYRSSRAQTAFTEPEDDPSTRAPTQAPPPPPPPPARPIPPPVGPVMPPGGLPARPPSAPSDLGGEDRRQPGRSWYRPAADRARLGDQPGVGATRPGRTPPMQQQQPAPATVVHLPPVFDSLMEILRENRLAQLATVDQQRELMRYMRGLNEWLERDVHDRQAELQAVIARVEQLRHDMRAMPAAGAPAPEPSDSSSSSGSDGSDGVPIVIPGQGPGFVAGQGPPFVPGQGQGPRVVPGQQGAPVVPGWPPLGFQPQHGGGPVIPQHGGEGPGTGVPFIPGNLPPPMQGVPQLYQFPQGPPPIPGIGPGGFVMPQSGPYTAGPPDATIPYIPRFGTGGSPLPGDPLVVPMPMSGRSSSSSGSSETTPRRTRRRPRRDSESGSESTVTGSSPERPIVIHPSTSGMPQQQQGQIPQGQTIIINPSAPAGSTQAPTYIPQVSIPVGSSRHHHSPRSSRSSRSSRSPRTPIQILPSRGHRSRSSRSRSSHRHTPPPPQVHIIQPSGAGPSAVPVGYPGTMPPGGYPGTMPQGPYPGTMPPTMIPTMVPSQAPIFVTGRSGSRSRSSSRGGRHGRRHDSRSRSRSSHGRHSPTVILQQQPPSSMPPMTQGPPIVLGPQGTGQPIVLTRRSHSRSRSRSYSPRQVYVRSHSGSRSGRHRSRSRSPRHGHEQPTIIMQPTTAGMPPMMMPSSRRSRSRSRSPVIITGSRRSRSPTHYDDRHRRRSRSRSRSPRHYPQTPVVVTAGTHRSHRSRSRSRSPRHYPTIIGHSGTHRSRSHRSRSRSRSPRHYPTIIGHSGTHRSRRSRSRSRSRSPRHYPTIIGHSGTHRSRSHRSRSGSRSPRHHSQPPIIMTGTHGTHRSRHSRSRSRSPTHLPTIIGSHHPSHHPSHFARSRSGSPESYRPHASHPSEHHIPIVVPRSGTQRSDTHRSGIHRPRSRSHSPTYIPHDHARSMSGSPSPHGPPRTHTAGSRSPSRHPRRPSRSERPSHSDRPSRSERPAHSERSVSPESPHTRTGSTRPHGSGASRTGTPGRTASQTPGRTASQTPGRTPSRHPPTIVPVDYSEDDGPEPAPYPATGRSEAYSPRPSPAPHLVRIPSRPTPPHERDTSPVPRSEYEGPGRAQSDRRSRPPTAVPVSEAGEPRFFDEHRRPISPLFNSSGQQVYPPGQVAYDADGRPLTPPPGHALRGVYDPRFTPAHTPAPQTPAPQTPAPHTPVPRTGTSGAAPSVRPVSDETDIPVPPPAVSRYDDPIPPPSMFEQPHQPVPSMFEQPHQPIRPLAEPSGRYSPRPTVVTPFPVDLAQADAERERIERLAEAEGRLQGVVEDAQQAEGQREAEFRKNEEDRDRIFMESEQRREQEARERQDAVWRDMEGLGAPPPRPPTATGDPGDGTSLRDGASIHTMPEAASEAVSILSGAIKDTVQSEREEFAREREAMAAERAQLEAERDAARNALMAEKEARVRALEEELATLRGDLENERQLRSTDTTEAQERERQAMADTAETRAQLGDITNLIQDQRDACERKKELMEERWNDKMDRRQLKEDKWVELKDMVQTIHEGMEADRQRAEEKRLADEGKPGIEKVVDDLRQQNAELQELLTKLSDSWRADSLRQHEETLAAVRATAQEQVHFNVQGYLDDFSKALASEVRMLLGEVGKLREERRALQHELGYLLCMKAKYGPGGEFEPDWKPPPGAPGGPPLDPGPPPPPPELPQARPGWRTVPQRPAPGARKPKKKDAAPPPPPTAAPAPDLRRQVTSWATWQPDPNMQPTPPSVEAQLLVPEEGSPGLFGPRSPRGSRYGG